MADHSGTAVQDFTPAELVTLAARTGRKFDASDVFTRPVLRELALDFLAKYEGDFAFLLDIRAQWYRNRRQPSDGQVKGILNCMVADVKRALRAEGAAVTERFPSAMGHLEPGYYTVVYSDESYITLRLRKAEWAQDVPAGTMVVGSRVGPGYQNFGFVYPDGTLIVWRSHRDGEAHCAARALLGMADIRAAGFAYATRSRKCWVCNLDLTTPASLAAGVGETCARARGLPYGG